MVNEVDGITLRKLLGPHQIMKFAVLLDLLATLKIHSTRSVYQSLHLLHHQPHQLQNLLPLHRVVVPGMVENQEVGNGLKINVKLRRNYVMQYQKNKDKELQVELLTSNIYLFRMTTVYYPPDIEQSYDKGVPNQ